jgi:transcriptional regulator with XRE-family HTH domain
MYDSSENLNLGKNLSHLRKKRGMSQKQVADFLNVHRTTYTYYEIGKTVPSLRTLMQLANLFEVDLDELLRAEPEEES